MCIRDSFQDSGFESLLKIARRKHDIVPVVVSDPREMEIPNVGLVRLQDVETGETVMLDTASRKNRELFSSISRQQSAARDAAFGQLQMTPIHLTTGEDLIEPLRRYFHLREARR